MTKSKITIDDLMKECNIDSPVEFRRLLKRNGLPSVSSKKLIDKDVADKIVERFLGHKIDWYKYEVRERDLIEPGPLKQKSNIADKYIVERWYEQITQDMKNILQQDQLLGLVCAGGFLEGANESEFILTLDPAINVLIGDRGSGKSTVLNLIGLLADSVSEETDVLVTKLLNLFKVVPDEVATINRRIRKGLYEYGVEKYACFFTLNNDVYSYYVDIENGSFDLLRLDNDYWESVATDEGLIMPSMHVLQQGEVIKIAEDRNKFYLHNILDSLYPDLYDRRTDFAHRIKGLVTQYNYYTRRYTTFNSSNIERFIDRRLVELRNLSGDIRRRQVSDSTIRLIRSYVDRFYTINRSALPLSIHEMLRGDEDAFFYLYLGRIIGFLSKSIKRIERLRAQQIALLDEFATSKEADEDQDVFEDTALNELMEDMSADKEILDQVEQLQDNEEDSTEDLDLFLAALVTDTDSPTGRKLLRQVQDIADFLQTRLRVLTNWVRIYTSKRVHWEESISALVREYRELLQERIDLIIDQEKKCRNITEQLNRDELEINIYTRGTKQIIAEHKSAIDRLKGIDSLYKELLHTTPRTRLRSLFELAAAYDSKIEDLFGRLNSLRTIAEPQNEFLFSPIDVELRQGNIYRDFRQLSFGQKSGIILKMVLATTSKRIILIDQPEDHLDANSIVNMLAPTLNRLGDDRQIIIATHNSNLVMGLHTNNLIVLGSLGENGRIRLQGSPLHRRQVVRDMLDVLEGGMETFNQKIVIYEDFISRVRGSIEDMDIMMIESSFRRRTIDGLRNFFQPVVSDRSLLDYVRHELKQSDYSRIQDYILSTRRELQSIKSNGGSNLDTLLEQIDKLCERLDSHILRLRGAIEEIRLMDTQSKPQIVDLYKLLIELKEDYLLKISKSRRINIEIDSKLQDQLVLVDQDHLRLVLRNLFSNALRATEKRAITALKEGLKDNLSEVLRIEFANRSNKRLTISFNDNGCGMPPEIQERLYIERCSDQKGRDHGLGGVIIRKLLDLNQGSIRIIKSVQAGENVGTIQEISLPCYMNVPVAVQSVLDSESTSA
jgi:signal transduction histidine kinase